MKQTFSLESDSTFDLECLEDWERYFEKIWDHREEIHANPSLRYVQCPGARTDIGFGWINGHFYLGSLLKHWESGLFKEACPVCHSDAYVLRIGGSILSQIGYWKGYCRRCQKIVHENRFLQIWKSIKRKREYNSFRPELLLEKGGKYIYDFKLGAIEPTIKSKRLFVPRWDEFLRWL